MRLPKSFYERPLTPKEAQFATDNINIVWWYLDQQGLDRAEWFDVVIFRYYEGFHDILTRKRTIIGEDGKLQEVDNLPNNRLVDNQFALMVDQKTNYLVGKPFSLTCRNKTYSEFLNKVFDKRFKRLLKYVCEDALKGGIGWLYPYYGDDGKLAFKHFPAHEILPFWADDDHTILDCAVRLYPQEVWSGYVAG